MNKCRLSIAIVCVLYFFKKHVLKEMFEGTKGVTRSRKSQNNRQYYEPPKNNDELKTTDLPKRTPLHNELRCSGSIGSFCRITSVINPVISHV